MNNRNNECSPSSHKNEDIKLVLEQLNAKGKPSDAGFRSGLQNMRRIAEDIRQRKHDILMKQLGINRKIDFAKNQLEGVVEERQRLQNKLDEIREQEDILQRDCNSQIENIKTNDLREVRKMRLELEETHAQELAPIIDMFGKSC